MSRLIEFLASVVIKGLLFGSLLIGLILFGIPLGTWVYVWLIPSRVDGTVLEKFERVGRHGRGWKVDLWLTAKYAPSASRGYELATITVDEGTWDRCRLGSRVEIAYVPVALLRQVPWFYTKRLAEPLPPLPPAPDVHRSGSAVIEKIYHITMSSGRRSYKLSQPYDVVVLRYTPEGRNEPVTVVDNVDAGSVSNLAVGKPVSFDYSMRRPRVVNIVGGRHDHEWRNYDDVLVLVVLVALALLIFAFLRRKSRRAANPGS